MTTDSLIKALEHIANPIAYFQNNLNDGEQLNSMYAITLSDDPNYLKSIAKNALEQLREQKPDEADMSMYKKTNPTNIVTQDFRDYFKREEQPEAAEAILKELLQLKNIERPTDKEEFKKLVARNRAAWEAAKKYFSEESKPEEQVECPACKKVPDTYHICGRISKPEELLP